MSLSQTERKHLVFDADDTLWENNIYFESAFTQFCEYLKHSELTPVQVRSVLDDIEIANAKIHGYGSKNFARNLAECYQKLAEHEISGRDLETVRQFAYAILEQPVEVIPTVRETVEVLSKRHELTIFTKGDPEEQRMKIEGSGLAPFFAHAAIVKEKNEAAYRALAAERAFTPKHTYMIGNSPKSDINPALAAGLNAVFVPHPRTWSLEHEEVPEEHPRLRRIASFGELIALFVQ